MATGKTATCKTAPCKTKQAKAGTATKTTTVTKASTPAKASKATAPAKKTPSASVEFTLMAAEAKEVFLVGDFNGWNGNGFQMRRAKDGTCKKKVQLKPGRYEYLFVVDGEWQCDPKNKKSCGNPFGSENSVIEV